VKPHRKTLSAKACTTPSLFKNRLLGVNSRAFKSVGKIKTSVSTPKSHTFLYCPNTRDDVYNLENVLGESLPGSARIADNSHYSPRKGMPIA